MCNAHAPYYVAICGLLRYTTFFFHYLIKGKIFRKKFLNIKCVLIFSTTSKYLKNFLFYEKLGEIS